MNPVSTRRQLLKSASFAGIGLCVSPTYRAHGSPNERLAIACLGVGGKGRSDSEHASHHGDVYAICDIDEKRLDAAAAKFPSALRYRDYRKLLSDLELQLDAVTVSAPDHHHAPASALAMRMGKHVYCQKPLTHSVGEARLLRDLAQRAGVCTQMGNQGTAHPGLRTGVELIRAGVIGVVREVHVWTNRPFKYWKQAPDIVARPTETPPCPDTVHWELFIGPAAMRPYHPVYHPHDWRGWWDFGTGSLGDMACHTTNLPFMALRLGLPTRVSAVHAEVNAETYPAWATITYEFPARNGLPPVKLTWYEGAKNGARNLPPAELFAGQTPTESGSLLIGDNGIMYSPGDNGAQQLLLPEIRFAGLAVPSTLPRIEGGDGIDDNHKREWIEAIKAGKPALALSNFDYAANLTETMLLGNVAVRAGHALEYDARSGKVRKCRDAEPFLNPPMRDGWRV